jgi:hypothetical protein
MIVHTRACRGIRHTAWPLLATAVVIVAVGCGILRNLSHPAGGLSAPLVADV